MPLENTYTVTGTTTGKLVFKFDLNGDLILFQYLGEPLTDKQRKWLYPRIAVHESMMKNWQAIKQFTVIKGTPDLSFENFWNTYNVKAKKKVCEALWKKMKDDNKFNAIAHIKRFDNWIRLKGTAKPLPDTYLRQERWLDEL